MQKTDGLNEAAGGFDIVVGNPPYVQVPKGLFDKNQFPYSEGKDKGKQNLYKVFVESSYNLTKESGYATMIVQSSLMCDISSQYIRELLLRKTEVKEIIEFPKKAKNNEGQVFESVLQGTCIYIFKHKIPEDNGAFRISIDNDITTIGNLKYEDLIQNEIIQFYPNGYFIPLIRKGEFKIIKKINLTSEPLKKYIAEQAKGDLNLGIEKHSFSKKMTEVKLLRGKNLHRYFIDYETDEFIQDNFRNNIVFKNSTYNYLVHQQITGTTDKYRLHFAITDTKYKFLCGDTIGKILMYTKINNYFILGILNSTLLDWYFRKTSTNNHVNNYEIEQLPIPNISLEKQQPIIALVNKILSAKKENPATDTAGLEREIDELVYGLYGLTEEEVGVICGRD